MRQDKKWSELGAGEKVQILSAVGLIISGIVLGFVSFVWLQFIPGSVLAQSGIYISAALAIFGIASYFKTEMADFQTKVRDRLDGLGDEIDRKIREDLKKEE